MSRQTIGGIFQFHVINPRLLSVNRIKGKILAALNKEEKEALRMMNMTIETWDNPPNMYHHQRYARGDIQIIVEPRSSGKVDEKNPIDSELKWNMLDKGFYRKVHMYKPPGFIRKTKPRNLQSHGGTSPSRLGISGPSMFPIRVKARQWSSIINRRMEARLAKNVQKAINEGIKPK